MEVKKDILGSIVIPAKGRLDLVERAIDSVLSMPGSEAVEIIVVDDGSEFPLAPTNLRSFDQLIRLNGSKGAAVCRNIGIRTAQGRVVHLLDSDDLILDRDFCEIAESSESGVVYYTEIESQGYKSSYPDEVFTADYFEFIFKRHKFIGQTSSLFFLNDGKFYFDETLPKHQDWDFAYCQVLLNGFSFRKSRGSTFFDRSDQLSLSRIQDSVKSIPWLSKLEGLQTLSIREYEYVRFNLLARTKALSSSSVLWKGINYFLHRKIYIGELARIFYRRVFS
ncbi:MAG: glycosyltransferase [bacterium]|nr:glycosyltransferase [bacterium]